MNCQHCGDVTYIDEAHRCCARLWNGRYCISCEASKAFWRDRGQRKRRR